MARAPQLGALAAGLLLGAGCAPGAGEKAAGTTAGPDTGAPTSTDGGAGTDGGDGSDGGDGGTDGSDTPPWPTAGDGTVPGGAMDCPNLQSPCNHQVRMAVSGDGEAWTVLDTPLATRASVAHVVPLTWGRWEGEDWGGLIVTYVDVFPANIPDAAPASTDNVLTTATIAFPWSAVETPEGLATVLAGDGPTPWVYRRTDTWQLGDAIVDPERELIETDTGLAHLLLVIDLDLETPPPDSDNRLYLLRSDDGISFEMVDEVDIPNPGTDPDCYPRGFTGAYPGVLPADWGLGGSGGWACHVSGYNEFVPHEGSLLAQARSTEVVRGATVTSTHRRDESWVAIGHFSPADAAFPGHSDLTEVVWDGEAWSPPRAVLATDSVPGTEGGLQAPNRLVLPTGVELLLFHGLIDRP